MDSRKDNEGIYRKGMNQSTPQSLAVNNHLSGHNNVTSSVDLIIKKRFILGEVEEVRGMVVKAS